VDEQRQLNGGAALRRARRGDEDGILDCIRRLAEYENGIYLEDLFVREGERRHGYGRALPKALAEACAERGYRRLEWSVLDWNEPSILTGVGHAQKQRLRLAAQVPVGPRPLNAHSPCARARRVGRSLGNRPPGAAIYSSP
jgi:GNAT superfamily N-acetyltransferase